MKTQPYLIHHHLQAKTLENNLLGDPIERQVAVYLPPDYSERNHYPLLMALAPYNNSGLGLITWQPAKENLSERLDRLILSGAMPPCIVVFPDCFTRLRGNQYINSRVVGNYQDFLIEEVVPFVEKLYSAGGPGYRGCFGKSSGGFGAITYGMTRPDIWSAVACHSGGMGFQWLVSGFISLISIELSRHNNNIEQFIRYTEGAYKLTYEEFVTLMFLSFCAAYDPDPSQFLGIRLPFDLYSGQWIAEHWNNWLALDPAFPTSIRIKNLSSLKSLYMDCGSYDQYHLQFGARILHKTLSEQKIKHYFEEFPDNHTDLDYRYDISLPFLVKAILENKELKVAVSS
jgi:enterochelin esterase-like enzyme